MDIQELSEDIIYKSEQYSKVMNICSDLLKNSPLAEEAREYLKSRVPSYSVGGFFLGYFPNDENIRLVSDIVGEKILKDLNLAYDVSVYGAAYNTKALVGKMRKHNIIMPYHNLYGDIIGLVGRTLLDKQEQKNKKISKYKNTSLPKALNLFGLYQAKNDIIARDSVILVEGQFDCITCHRFGFKNVVALGSASFSKFQFYLLQRYTNNIFLLLDNDNAGNIGRENIINRFGQQANIQTIILDPIYKDVDEYLIKSSDYNLLFGFIPK